MNTLNPLSEKELSAIKLITKAAEDNMGFVPNSLKTLGRNPAILGSFGMLTANIIGKKGAISPWTALKMTLKNLIWTGRNLNNEKRVPLYLRHLVGYISSRAAGCMYCQAHTIESAHLQGASKEKLESVWDFENSPHFDDSERVALRFGLAAGSVPNQVNQKHFEDLKNYYSEDQIIDLGATVALFGFLNRWNDTFATPLEKQPAQFAQDILGGSGWKVGKHG